MTDDTLERPCRSCGGSFMPSRAAMRKRNYICSSCSSARRNEWKRAHKDRVASANAAWKLAHPDRVSEYTRRQEQKRKLTLRNRKPTPQTRKPPPLGDRHKRRARGFVNNWLRRGKLARLPCARCGNPKSQAHHPDYTRPLLILWLCSSCHAKEHTA